MNEKINIEEKRQHVIKKKIKELTFTEQLEICKRHINCCDTCPININGICFRNICDYSNATVEIEVNRIIDKYEQILEDKINAARIEYTTLVDMRNAGYDKRATESRLLTEIRSYEHAITQYRLLKAKGEI